MRAKKKKSEAFFNQQNNFQKIFGKCQCVKKKMAKKSKSSSSSTRTSPTIRTEPPPSRYRTTRMSTSQEAGQSPSQRPSSLKAFSLNPFGGQGGPQLGFWHLLILCAALAYLGYFLVYRRYFSRPRPPPEPEGPPPLTLQRWLNLFLTGRVVPTGILVLTALAGALLVVHMWQRRLTKRQAEDEWLWTWTRLLMLVCIIYWTFCKFVLGWAHTSKDKK